MTLQEAILKKVANDDPWELIKLTTHRLGAPRPPTHPGTPVIYSPIVLKKVKDGRLSR